MRKLFFLLFIFATGLTSFNTEAQNTWVNKAPYGGGMRDEASGFAIGNTGYILSGTDTGSYFMDMWAWNSSYNVWNEAASYPGGERVGTRSVSLNGFGYVLGGEHPSNCFLQIGGGVCGGTFYNDVWRYNPDSNTWVIDTAFPGAARNFAVAVADPDDSTIYYGTGNNNGTSYFSDWWAFYTPAHTWTQLADFPGGQRANAVGFFANGAIYIGTGDDNDSLYAATNDFWKYNPASNTWAQITHIPGMPLRSASAFSIGNYGYVCLGLTGNSTYTAGGWRYNTVTDSWQAITNYGGGVMADGVAFTIDTNGYVGTGVYVDSAYSRFWEYTFDNSPALGITTLEKNQAIGLYPNPAKKMVTIDFSGINAEPVTFTLIDIFGNEVLSCSINNTSGKAMEDVSNLTNGIYLYRISDAGKLLETGKIIITR